MGPVKRIFGYHMCDKGAGILKMLRYQSGLTDEDAVGLA